VEVQMSIRRVVSLLLLAAYLPACTSYQATTQPVAELTATPKPPEHLRVTTNEGVVVEVDGPRVVNDSLFGTTVASGPRGEPATKAVAIPLSGIRTVEVKRPDGSKTTILVIGIVGAMVLLGVAAANSMDDMVDLSGMTY
jgi:hypothetical protein